MHVDRKVIVASLVVALILTGVGVRLALLPGEAQGADAPASAGARVNLANNGSVDITDDQQKYVKVQTAEVHHFEVTREAVGHLDFDQERMTPISPPYPGRVLTAPIRAGDEVARGRVLFTIESPDLIQAESTLISAAGTLQLTRRNLEREEKLVPVQAVPQRELESAIADEQSAAASLSAARDAVRIFGKSDVEMDRMISERRVDRSMAIESPIAGRVVARNAAPGMLVQPGSDPPPYILADVSSIWLEASVPESDIGLIRVGQSVVANVPAYPQRSFTAHVMNIGDAVDPATHRILVRADIADPKHELRAQMQATMVIHTGTSVDGPAVPQAGVVREGDGSMSVWITRDGHHFERRSVRIGAAQDGLDQVTSGLAAGEKVAGDGALFLSNALNLATP